MITKETVLEELSEITQYVRELDKLDLLDVDILVKVSELATVLHDRGLLNLGATSPIHMSISMFKDYFNLNECEVDEDYTDSFRQYLINVDGDEFMALERK